MSVHREAARDAKEFARAQVFYGEGAGNRRKLIKTAVNAKMLKSPAYRQAFDLELGSQDMVHHVRKARRERHRRDVAHALNKNTRNAMSGRYTGVNMVVIVTGGALYYAHKTGRDKEILEKGKEKLEQIKLKHPTWIIFRNKPQPPPPVPRPRQTV